MKDVSFLSVCSDFSSIKGPVCSIILAKASHTAYEYMNKCVPWPHNQLFGFTTL